MGLGESISKIGEQGAKLDPGTLLFVDSLHKVEAITQRGLGVLKNPDGTPMEVPFPEPLGIATELAAVHAINSVKPNERPDKKASLVAEVTTAREVAWNALFTELPEQELLRLLMGNNSVIYFENAQAAALKILSANSLRTREREMTLRIGLPQHIQTMKRIREGVRRF